MGKDESKSSKNSRHRGDKDSMRRKHDDTDEDDIEKNPRNTYDYEECEERSRWPQSSVVRVTDRERRQRSPSSEGEIRSDVDSSDHHQRSPDSRRNRSNSYRRHRYRSRTPDHHYRSRDRDRYRKNRDREGDSRRKESRSNDKENSSRGDDGGKQQAGKGVDERAEEEKKKDAAKVASSATVTETNTTSVVETKKNVKAVRDVLTTRTGGAYIPPAKLRMMQQQIMDKSSAPYQRLAWEALKKSITGLVNKVNKGNLGIIVRELFKENIVRGRGLLSRCIIQAQNSSPTFTHIYAALVAVINSKFPKIGELLLRRLVIQFRRGFRRNDKALCISSVKFIAHLVNQCVAHEILALEILTLLVENPTDDSVEVAIAFLKECGDKLTEVSSKALHSIFEMLRNILHEGALDKRVQYMIEVMFQVRKDGFKDHKSVEEGLDVVEEEDQFTHLITLEEATDPEDVLNVFKFDPEFEANEEKYAQLRKELLDEDTDDGDSGESGSGSGSEDSEESDKEEGEATTQTIIDNTETNLIALRRTIYLTITSSLDFEECAHKLLRMSLKPGQESELCHMFLDCCAQQRTYEKFYGLLAQRFCQMNKIYVAPFEKIFQDTYSTVHRLETKMLRNVAKFFGHLLFTDAISWEVLHCVRLTEEDTNSSSRIFIKILFQELSEYMGLQKLNDRVKDPTLQTAFEGLFPRDNPKNTRFAINFFTSIGLGGLTDELREHLKAQPKAPVVPALVQALPSSSSSSSDSSSSSSSSSSMESSSSEDSEPEAKRKRKKSKQKNKAKASKKKKKNVLEKKGKKPRK